MTKTPLVKCPVCKEQFNREEGTKVSSRWYHYDCLEKKRQENKESQKTGKVRAANDSEYAQLIAYICELYNMKRPSGMIMRQIKEFKDKYEYTDKTIRLSLKYFYEIEDNSVLDESGIGIVPYVHDRAIKFFYQLYDLHQANYEESERRTINVSKRDRTKKRNRQIDINEL